MTFLKMRAWKWLTPSLIVFLIAIGLLVVWPEPGVRILVPADGWEVEGGFVSLPPPTRDIRESAVNDAQMRFWRSWSPGHGSQPGSLRTKPFVADGPFAVPYNGFSGEPGIVSYVECMGSGQRIHLATSRNNTQWSEVRILHPKAFCTGPVRVVASSTSTKDYIALGSPYRLSRISMLKQSTLIDFWFVVLAWGVVAGWFMLFAGIASRQIKSIAPVTAGLIGIGLIGYLQFFTYWYLPPLGQGLSVLMAVVGLWVSTATSLGHNPLPALRVDFSPLRSPTLLWLALAVSYLALATLIDSGAGAWEPNGRFTPARWSTDNQLPAFVSRILVSGQHGDTADFGPWTIADRPPLSYGWHASLHDLFDHLTRLNDGASFFYRYQLATGIVLNTCWTAFLALALPALGLSRLRTLLTMIVLSLCPLFIFNDIFVWPKLLSGTFTLAAAWILLGVATDRRRLREDTVGLVAAAILSALGLLTHGGSAFGILAMLILAVFYRGLPSFRGAMIAGVAALTMLSSWSIWQSNNHFASNTLVKFAFAGTFGFDEKNMGLAQTILRSYQGLGLDGWLEKKFNGLLTILFGLRNTCGIGEMAQPQSLVDGWRISDFVHILPSLNFLLLGFLALAVKRAQPAATVHLRLASARLLVFAALSIAITWLMTWDCYINHHQSYQALMALHLGLILALSTAGRLGMLALACNVLYALVTWIAEPISHFPRVNTPSAIVFAAMATLGVIAPISMWIRRKRENA